MYIYQMSTATQNKIKRELVKVLKREGYKGYWLNELVNEAMSGKLSDIDDLINVGKYRKAVM